MSTHETREEKESNKGVRRKKRGQKLLLFAAGFFAIYVILYATTGGGPTSLLVGTVMGLFSLSTIVCLAAGIFYLIAGLVAK